MNSIIREFQLFMSKPLNMRVLLVTNLIYWAVLPISNIFSTAYVMRNAQSVVMVVVYQIASYSAIPLAFWVNGLLLNRLHVRIERLLSFGMLLSGVSMIVMMTLKTLDIKGLAIAGFLMSLSSGFYWSNRDFLALSTTSDDTRSYYYGLDQFFNSIVGMITPFIVGTLWLGGVLKYHWFNLEINHAYQIVVGFVFLLTVLASYVIHQGKFRSPKKTNFVHFKFHPKWRWMQCLTVLRGMSQGFMVFAPTALTMTLVGNEGAVGWVNFGGGVISALTMYLLGRLTGPQHRLKIYSVAVILFAFGGVTNGVLFSAAGVFTFIALQNLAMPLQEISYFGTQMLMIDVTSYLEKRNEYAYIFNLEFSYLVGRCSGLVFYIVCAKELSETFALRYALGTVAVIQLLGILIVNNLLKWCAEEKAHEHNQGMSAASLNAQVSAEA